MGFSVQQQVRCSDGIKVCASMIEMLEGLSSVLAYIIHTAASACSTVDSISNRFLNSNLDVGKGMAADKPHRAEGYEFFLNLNACSLCRKLLFLQFLFLNGTSSYRKPSLFQVGNGGVHIRNPTAGSKVDHVYQEGNGLQQCM